MPSLSSWAENKKEEESNMDEFTRLKKMSARQVRAPPPSLLPEFFQLADLWRVVIATPAPFLPSCSNRV